jgi:polysaccharide export outer membrane protein
MPSAGVNFALMQAAPWFPAPADEWTCATIRGLLRPSAAAPPRGVPRVAPGVARPLFPPLKDLVAMPSVQLLIRRLRSFALVASAALLGACGSMPGSFPPAPVGAAAGDYSYVIGAGDSLNIIVWRNPELSMSVPVRPDGKVSAPLVDEIVAQGKTSVQMAREVEQALSKYVRDPVVTVIVTSFTGPYSEQIRVVGEAAKPQFLAYKQKMTVLDVMIAVGGLTDFADGNAATILRTSDANKQYSVRLKDLIKRGDVSANVEMRPGDILIIPQSFF